MKRIAARLGNRGRRLMPVLLLLVCPPQAGAADAEEAACRQRLAAIGAEFRELPAITEPDGCGATAPLLLSAVGGMALRLPATLTCAAAEALARWVADAVVPEAERHLGARPDAILAGTSYQCRTQHRQPGARLSEHAFANGLDVGGIAFRGRAAVHFAPAGGDEARFAAAVRAKACRHFTTVLGPGGEGGRATHLHLDLRRRKGDYRICQ